MQNVVIFTSFPSIPHHATPSQVPPAMTVRIEVLACMDGVLPTPNRHHCPRFLEVMASPFRRMTYALETSPPGRGLEIDEKSACHFHYRRGVKGRTPRGTLVPVSRSPSIPSSRVFGRFSIESAPHVGTDNPSFSFYCAVWSEEPFNSVPTPSGPIRVPIQAAAASNKNDDPKNFIHLYSKYGSPLLFFMYPR